MASLNGKQNGTINGTKLKGAMDVLKCLAHPVRLSILDFIHGEGEVHVNKIYNSLKLEQSITSQHLRVLRDHDMVSTTRNGKYIIYSVNKKKLFEVGEAVNSFVTTQK